MLTLCVLETFPLDNITGELEFSLWLSEIVETRDPSTERLR